jgi:hypothetical protein
MMEVCMAPKQSVPLPAPVNVRIPEDLLETIRNDAAKNERTLSAQMRYLLRTAVAIQEEKSGMKS